LKSRVLILAAFVGSTVAPCADYNYDFFADTPAYTEVLDKYMAATRTQQSYLKDVSMEVEMEGTLPSLKKTGKMHALRSVSRLGKITYQTLTFQGDNTIKKDVIARYLQAEAQAGESKTLAITPENYKFRYRGLFGSGDWQLHLFELTPKQKKVGLFKGFLWIEARTGMPVREQGRFVKNPSIFLKRVEFVRDYNIGNGVAVPSRIESSVDTRLVGKAELTIRYNNYSKAPDSRAAGAAAPSDLGPSR